MSVIIDIAGRRELFVDRFLIETLEGISFRLHSPRPVPLSLNPLRGVYMSILSAEDKFQAYCRQKDLNYPDDVLEEEGNEGEITCYAESTDGVEWQHPKLRLCEAGGSKENNIVLRLPPFSHNFSPFIDHNHDCPPEERYKALAGVCHSGLHAFVSGDGIHWRKKSEHPVIRHNPGIHGINAFDSQNVAFWAEAENCYVCYFRSWKSSHGSLRTVSRCVSPDFQQWGESVCLDPNLPGEQLYTNQTAPYFRAPHIYLALPTRYQGQRGSSTDILFMATRAGSDKYERLFPEAFITPGPEPARWGNRSNYAACGIIPTGPGEISIYHQVSGQRYTLRTDGFVSLSAGYTTGIMTSKIFTFSGEELLLNMATSAGGVVKVELQDENGRSVPGRSLEDADELVGDALNHRVTWKGISDLSACSGKPVRLRLMMREADLYSLVFRTHYYGRAAPMLKEYFTLMESVLFDKTSGSGSLEELLADFLDKQTLDNLNSVMCRAQAVAGSEIGHLSALMKGIRLYQGIRDFMDDFLNMSVEQAMESLDNLQKQIQDFDPVDVFGKGPGLYPPTFSSWSKFRRVLEHQLHFITGEFSSTTIISNLDKGWRFQTDPEKRGMDKGWLQPDFDISAWDTINADRWWQKQGYPDYHGVAWYCRDIESFSMNAGKKAVLFFGAVDGDVTLFVNGALAGKRLIGTDNKAWFEPFFMDISDFVTPDQHLRLAIRVNKDCFMSGIFRGVKLLFSEK